MGFFGYLGFMECYHGVVSMTHFLEGQLTLNETTIEFHHSKGYAEKDWGRSFPKAYVWFQSNHFSDITTSVLFSYADIPFMGRHFQGLIVNLLYQGKEYRFATYNGAKITLEQVGDGRAEYRVKRGRYELELLVASTVQTELAAPRDGLMIERIRLFHRGKLVYEDLGTQAGIEIMKSHKA
ncbi:MAG: tocopherol cyclase family protein [Firmicutes bacterium]|nr:tocopherol cyclase family protein [Bacillota bacterium]